ncbi:MAG: amidohydrolase [Clostridia bacterium]|nr:amidohydrolase [Clostridia bacterium]
MKTFKVIALILVFCLMLGNVYAVRPPESNMTILYNGKVFTGDGENPWAQGLVIVDRFIVKVGTSEEVLEYQIPDAQVIDLKGKTVIPGLNNAHAHSFWASSYPHAVRVNAPDFIPGPGPTFEEVLNLVAQAVAKTPAGTWIFANIGSSVVENSAVNRFLIDQVAPNHPVMFFAWWGHGTYFNTKAMNMMGISEQEADPYGGFYERMPGTNIVKGIAHEYAEFRINRYFANQMTNEEFISLFKAFEKDAFKKGITSVQDYPVGVEQTKFLNLLSQADTSLRWRVFNFPLTLDDAYDNRPEFSPINPFSLIKASGIKWITDGTPIERLGYITTEYLDSPGWSGRSNFSINDFEAFFKQALKGLPQKTQLSLHITGDKNWDNALNVMSSLVPDNVWEKRRVRIEHGDLMRPDHFNQVKNKGIVLVQNPSHFGSAGLYAQRFQPSVLSNMMPYRSLFESGIPVALGTDAIGAVGDPYLDLFLSLIHPTRPTEAITIEQAVTAYTYGGAYAEFQECFKGTLKPGKFADIAVLSQDIFTLPPPAILGTESVLTIVGGKIVYNNL